jgi:hypothetical protein
VRRGVAEQGALYHHDPSLGSSEVDLVYETNYLRRGLFRAVTCVSFASRYRLPLEPTQPPHLTHVTGYFDWATHYTAEQDILFTPSLNLEGMELKQKGNFAITFT